MAQSKSKKSFLRQWRFTLVLICAVAAGALLGYIIGPKAKALKPLGDVLLNLLFTAVVPLVFFSLSSAVAASNNLKRLGRIAGLMLVVFVTTGFLSSCLMLFTVKIFDPAKNITLELAEPPSQETGGFAEKIVTGGGRKGASVPGIPRRRSRSYGATDKVDHALCPDRTWRLFRISGRGIRPATGRYIRTSGRIVLPRCYTLFFLWFFRLCSYRSRP